MDSETDRRSGSEAGRRPRVQWDPPRPSQPLPRGGPSVALTRWGSLLRQEGYAVGLSGFHRIYCTRAVVLLHVSNHISWSLPDRCGDELSRRSRWSWPFVRDRHTLGPRIPSRTHARQDSGEAADPSGPRGFRYVSAAAKARKAAQTRPLPASATRARRTRAEELSAARGGGHWRRAPRLAGSRPGSP